MPVPNVKERVKWPQSLIILVTDVLQFEAVSAPHCCDKEMIEAFLIKISSTFEWQTGMPLPPVPILPSWIPLNALNVPPAMTRSGDAHPIVGGPIFARAHCYEIQRFMYASSDSR
jgi:hypothetical protein